MTLTKLRMQQNPKGRWILDATCGPRLAIFAGLACLCCVFVWGGALAATATAPAGATPTGSVSQDIGHLSPVGFEAVRIPNGGEAPLAAGIWYPTSVEPRDVPLESFTQRVAPSGPVEGRALPLIVISHGGGG